MGVFDKFSKIFLSSKVDVQQRFELLKEAVSGTMSSFYMARDRTTDEVVGLKVGVKEKVEFFESRFKGLKNREIADKLQISTTAVEKHIAKALQCFSKHFKDKYPVDIYIMIIAWVIMNNK